MYTYGQGVPLIKLRHTDEFLHPGLRNVVEYRKSGLSLNHVVGCPLDCGYCVRHLFGNFEMKQPHLVMEDRLAIECLVTHWAFVPHRTPIQIFNRATDPFLPGVKEHLFSTLELLDAKGLTNLILIITRWHVHAEDVARLDALKHLRITVLVTWSGIDDQRIEPVESSIAESSLRTLHATAVKIRCLLYWRPLIAGFNDSIEHMNRAAELAEHAHATVFTGLFFRDEIRAHFRSLGVPDLYEEIARRKILPGEVERKVLDVFAGKPIFRKTSCGVGYAHATSDYNGHFGIKEICEICPAVQVARCKGAHRKPGPEEVDALVSLAGLDPKSVEINEGKIEVSSSTEQQRYFVQHSLNFQVHDRAQPHALHRHGRAEVGWL